MRNRGSGLLPLRLTIIQLFRPLVIALSTGGPSVVLSGDTRFSENLIKFAKGTDLLVHEVVIAPDTLRKTDPKYSIFAHHTSPEQASKVFSEVKPKLAVYSHISKLYGQGEALVPRP